MTLVDNPPGGILRAEACRGAHCGDHQLAMGCPGLVRCRRCSMLKPPYTVTEVSLCHSEAMTGWR